MNNTLPCSRILCPSPFRYETLNPWAPHHSGVRSFLALNKTGSEGGWVFWLCLKDLNDGLLCGSRKTVSLSFYILESHVLDDVEHIPDIDHGTLLVLLCMYRWLCCAVQKGQNLSTFIFTRPSELHKSCLDSVISFEALLYVRQN